MTNATSNNFAARDEILASIRQNLSASRPFDAEHQKHHRSAAEPAAAVVTAVPLEMLIENFRAGLAFVGANCRVVNDEQEAALELKAIVAELSAQRIAISNSALVARVIKPMDGVEVLENAAAAELFRCDVGVTSAQWAIAETGTLVLESDHESSRLTSLVPPVHLCVVRATDIRQTLGEVLQALSGRLSAAITFITGASRTSDIELTLAIGVHGPKELRVIVVREQR